MPAETLTEKDRTEMRAIAAAMLVLIGICTCLAFDAASRASVRLDRQVECIEAGNDPRWCLETIQ